MVSKCWTKFPLGLLLLILSAFLLSGCQETSAGGSNDVDDEVIPDKPFVEDYVYDTHYGLQIWKSGYGSNLLTYSALVSSGSIKASAINGYGWAGGSFAHRDPAVPAYVVGFDFSSVSTITFEVRSSLDTGDLRFLIQNGASNILDVYFNTLLAEGIDDENWSAVEVDVTALQLSNITSAFSFVMANTVDGDWVEFRNINWVDADGNSVWIVP